MTFIQVKSSSGDGGYNIFFGETDGKVRVTCSCQAGLNRMACKHRLSLIDGDIRAVIVGAEHVSALRLMVEQSPIPPLILEIAQLEHEADAIKKRISAAKKKLGAALG